MIGQDESTLEVGRALHFLFEAWDWRDCLMRFGEGFD